MNRVINKKVVGGVLLSAVFGLLGLRIAAQADESAPLTDAQIDQQLI